MNLLRIVIFAILFFCIFFLYKNQANIELDKTITESILNSLSNTPFSNSFPSSSSYTLN
jgi:hypothetical protein